jgi:hypothetical protein
VYGRRAFELLLASACAAASFVVLNLASSAAALPSRLVFAVVDLVVLTLFTGYVVHVAIEVFESGRPRTPQLLLRAVKPVFGELMFVGFVTGLTIGLLLSIASTIVLVVAITGALNVGVSAGSLIGFAAVGAIVFFVPGLLLMTIWSVVAPVVVLERPGGLRALRRSRQLVRGNRLRVLGMIVMLIVPLVVFARALEFVSARVGSGLGLVGTLVATVLVAPIPVLCATALYYELRDGEAAGTAETAVTPLPTG